MRVPALLPTVFIASAAASTLLAQQPQITRIGPSTIIGGRGAGSWVYAGESRAVIGVSTTNSSSSRDTLGVLVATVRSGSPADKAGIEEGNRIASINGVNLKLAAADIGDDAMAGVLSRRLSRELDKLKPGDDVDLQVYANGQTKPVKIKTIAPEDLDNRMHRLDDRPTLGLNLASTGSARDTIGVFVMGVEDGGPAAKAGIEEGSRIASINGVDLKGRKIDDEDWVFRRSNVTKLGDEVSRMKAGDVADLRVYYNGQYHNVKVTVGKMGDLPRHNRTVRVIGGDSFTIPPMPDFNLEVSGVDIGDKVRRALDEARIGTASGFDKLNQAFSRFGRRVDW
jgi:predicted metalloprotease with PDZ domain